MMFLSKCGGNFLRQLLYVAFHEVVCIWQVFTVREEVFIDVKRGQTFEVEAKATRPRQRTEIEIRM